MHRALVIQKLYLSNVLNARSAASTSSRWYSHIRPKLWTMTSLAAVFDYTESVSIKMLKKSIFSPARPLRPKRAFPRAAFSLCSEAQRTECKSRRSER